LKLAQAALQEEVAHVPPIDRNGLPDFHNLQELVQDNFRENARHPALHPTEIVLVQLGHFIAYVISANWFWARFEKLIATVYRCYEQVGESYPNLEDDVVVGVCFGELSAAAVSLAKNIIELIPLAIDSVRLAFRAGIASSVVGDGLEQRTLPARPWSATISRQSGLDNEKRLQELAVRLGIPKIRRPYITSFSRKTVTIGAPPSTLEKVIACAAENTEEQSALAARRSIEIYAPYHAVQLFSREDVRHLLHGPGSATDLFPNGKSHPIYRNSNIFIGSATGEYYKANNRLEFMEDVLYNILAQPIYWEKVVNACKQLVGESQVSNWRVRPFAQPNLARSLSSALKSMTSHTISLDEGFGLESIKTPRSRHLPIAIVGMAGRFPKGDSPEALWEILQAGVDCHTEVIATNIVMEKARNTNLLVVRSRSIVLTLVPIWSNHHMAAS
jgi:hypothetical protein